MNDIAIVGGGLAGLASALALAGPAAAPTGLHVTVIERGAGRAPHDLRASALTASSVRMLQALAVWPALANEAQAVSLIRITDGELGDGARPPFLIFDTKEGAADGSDAAVIVENRHLHQALLDAVTQHPAIDLLVEETVQSFSVEANRAVLGLAGGKEVAARLAVAADGAQSPLRALAGIRIVAWDYAQWGLVGTIGLQHDHDGVAVQHFLPGGPFAMLPLTNKRASLVWSEPADAAAAVLALDRGAQRDAIQQRLGHEFGSIELLDEPQGWPLSFLMARSFIGERLALAGDAAHRVHPLAGQGFNLGLKDAAALADCVLDAARLGLDFAAAPVLERYQRWRRFDAAQHALATDTLNRLFSNANPALRLARDVGLGLVDRVPVLKSFLVREAAGDVGTPPRLMRGEAA